MLTRDKNQPVSSFAEMFAYFSVTWQQTKKTLIRAIYSFIDLRTTIKTAERQTIILSLVDFIDRNEKSEQRDK